MVAEKWEPWIVYIGVGGMEFTHGIQQIAKCSNTFLLSKDFQDVAQNYRIVVDN